MTKQAQRYVLVAALCQQSAELHRLMPTMLVLLALACDADSKAVKHVWRDNTARLVPAGPWSGPGPRTPTSTD